LIELQIALSPKIRPRQMATSPCYASPAPALTSLTRGPPRWWERQRAN